MESKIDKYVKDLNERIDSNRKTIEEIYYLVITTITKKRDDYLANMIEIKEREAKLSLEKKLKIGSHIESIDQFLSLQKEIDNFSDLEILEANKRRDDTLKQATKNAVDCSFSLSVIPELKKETEINNFGQQLKISLRDLDQNDTTKSTKTKKNKKIQKPNKAKQSKNTVELKTDENNETVSAEQLNTSHDTELSTPVCISAKTPLFENQNSNPASKIEDKINKKWSKVTKKESELPPQPKTITTQVLNSRNSKQKDSIVESSKHGTSSFAHQNSNIMDKLSKFHSSASIENFKKVVPTKNETVENFNEFLDSTQQIQRERAKRKKQNINNFQQFLEDNKNPTMSENLPLSVAQSTETNTENDTQEPESVKSSANDRSWRSYLRHTKTSRMKSVNRRDQKVKDNIRNEAALKLDPWILKQASKEALPPTWLINSTSANSNFMKNTFKRPSPTFRVNEEVSKSSMSHSGMFKLEGKSNLFDKRKGSQTNRDEPESIDNKFNFKALEDRRAEHKKNRQKHHASSNSNIPNIKNIERNVEERQERIK